MRTCDDFVLDLSLLSRYRSGIGVAHEVAVVGAGRWAKVLLGVLSDFRGPSRIHLVAEHNYPATERWLREVEGNGSVGLRERVVVQSNLDEVLASDSIEMAIVTKMASQHHDVTRQLLLAGKHVLVEKPFVLEAAQAAELVQLAKERGRSLAVGYEFMFARAFHHLRENIARHLAEVSEVQVLWQDVRGVKKWGLRKHPDLSANVVTDVYPHVISLLSLLFGSADVRLRELTSTDRCWQARLELEYASVPVTVALDKEATEPLRTISVSSANGRSLQLDFTMEPGVLTLDGEALPSDELARAYPSSLSSEIAYFFAHMGGANGDMPNSAGRTIHVVEAMEAANHEMSVLQTQTIREDLWREPTEDVPPEILTIMRHHLVGQFMDHGVIGNPKDTDALDAWAARAYRIAHRFSRDPWTTQQSVLTQEDLDKEQLISLNAAMRSSPFVQNLMLGEGLAYKYWKTIVPLIETGSIHAVMTNSYQFPLRVGVYPAVSCMFHCSFCGRNQVDDVRYAQDSIETGNEMFDSVLAAMPRGISTLSLGGGLEPLTNPKLDDVIRSAKRHGHRVPLVTNGYMLTPHFVGRHEALWDLDVLRVSCYGVDDDSYFGVTKRRGAFTLVKNNLVAFLKERNRRGSSLKLGLNFIVLINTTDQVLRLLDLVREIESAVGGPGVDFLTLREDFSVPETDGLTKQERERLVNIFEQFKTRHAAECPDLRVDFGYALHALSDGVVGKPLAMVTHEGMLPRAYPQVSVAIDLLGDVYLYRDAAFPDRPGADRYIIGRITKTRPLEQIVKDFLESGHEIPPHPDDPALMDAFDHVVTKLILQAEADEKAGIPFNSGPIAARQYQPRDGDAPESTPRVVNYWQSLFGM